MVGAVRTRAGLARAAPMLAAIAALAIAALALASCGAQGHGTQVHGAQGHGTQHHGTQGHGDTVSAPVAAGGTASAGAGTAQLRAGGPRVPGLGDAFAGLVRLGALNSIGAAWRVPAIRADSQPGQAATWIGAQGFGRLDPAQGSHSAPFIQIGTREQLQRADGQNTVVDEAFWTDVVRGLRPVTLFRVQTGDAIVARMSLDRGRWTLTITDRTTGRSRRLSTEQEGGGRFSIALWLQEDPTREATNRVFPYPDIAPLYMTGLTVNARRPAPDQLKTTWMALPHAYLAPTLLGASEFVVAPRALSPAGARFLAISRPADAAVTRFVARAATWRARTPARTIRMAVRRLITALSRESSQLRAGTWPAAVAGPVRRVAAEESHEVLTLGRALTRGASAVLAALPHGRHDAGEGAQLEQIRRGLGLPLFSY